MAEHEKKDVDHISGIETTGHEWDGIKELDNPLPRWWLILFYASIVYSLVYWVLMPAWPGLPGAPGASDHTAGLRNHSDRALVQEDVNALRAARADDFAALAAADFSKLSSEDPLFRFAQEAGESAFGDNCATCHRTGGAGGPGYPSLADNDWLWGGTLADIEHTIRVGIRSDHPEARFNLMPAYGRDQIFTAAEVEEATDYVVQISGGEPADAAAAARGAALFAVQCVSCHGADGKGIRTMGAPDLTDQVWLYGGTREAIKAQIVNGRGGVMPTWEARLDAGTIKALAIYVHALGGGEAEPAPVAATVTE